ncbi:MAG: cation diffusion facilitator family transporter [Gammaproteobacteria bacterium]
MNTIENRYLRISAAGNLIMAMLGIGFAVVTDSQAILLDGLFDLTYLVAALFTFKVAQLVHREDDDRFPYGYAYFEPLVNGVKGLLVLGVSIMALADAIDALLSGGRAIAAGFAIVYAIAATLGCVGFALIVRRGAHRCVSPLLVADAKNWLVNAAISACVLVAFSSILLLRDSSYVHLVPYVDPVVVVSVIVISLSVPVRMAWQAMMELLNRAPPDAVTRQVRSILEESIALLPVEDLFVRVLNPGRTRMVLAHVVLPESFQVQSLKALDAIRKESQKRLREAHLATILDMVFTSDRIWGAPTAIPVRKK